MKNNQTFTQLVVITLTLLIMTLLAWGVLTGRLLDHKESLEQLISSMLNKIK